MASANGVSYTYDGDGRRVEKSSGTIYWYDASGNVIEETDASGNLVSDYFYVAGKRMWREDASGNVYTYFSDPLGTVRYIAGPNNTESESDWYPFGGERVISDTLTSPNHYKFTGMERDTETGLDHTLYRQYSSPFGRWLSPDPKRGCIMNPQNFDRYAYVQNNPATRTDPLGLDDLTITCYAETVCTGPPPGEYSGVNPQSNCTTTFHCVIVVGVDSGNPTVINVSGPPPPPPPPPGGPPPGSGPQGGGSGSATGGGAGSGSSTGSGNPPPSPPNECDTLCSVITALKGVAVTSGLACVAGCGPCCALAAFAEATAYAEELHRKDLGCSPCD